MSADLLAEAQGARFKPKKFALGASKAVKDAARVTLNDVVLATVAGALDRFFELRGETLSRPLIASVPMAVIEPNAALRPEGNRVAALHIRDAVLPLLEGDS